MQVSRHDLASRGEALTPDPVGSSPDERVVANRRGVHVRSRWQRWITFDSVFLTIAALVVLVGWRFPTERFISPAAGLGYALGITGGSLMLILLLYPLRKRIAWFSKLGSVKAWFQVHIVFGVVGPICVLYHSNFSLGATNSNVALALMLVILGSGLLGRYFYAKIHDGLTGHETNYADLKANTERLRTVTLSVKFMPELLTRLANEEKHLVEDAQRCPALLRPLYLAWCSLRGRLRLNRHVRLALTAAASQSQLIDAHRDRLQETAYAYIDRRMSATQSVAEYQTYANLFSWWHLLHLPLFFLMLVAGIVHVVAVHAY